MEDEINPVLEYIQKTFVPLEAEVKVTEPSFTKALVLELVRKEITVSY